MATKYSCKVRIENGFPKAINDVVFRHFWDGNGGNDVSFPIGTMEGNSESIFYTIESGSDGYDYWWLSFTYGPKSYAVEKKRCSLNSLDEDTLLTFRIQYKDEKNPYFLLTMNSDSCKEEFKETT
ncbi:MAG: hypothetical protein SFU91_11985 [Chloroherpetonaceae bacterium]|nr:hypothetical protein [Chloroherpetonaceae bacterium]